MIFWLTTYLMLEIILGSYGMSLLLNVGLEDASVLKCHTSTSSTILNTFCMTAIS